MKNCPKCDSSIEESTVICRYCRSRIVDAPPKPAGAVPVGAGQEKSFEIIDVPAPPTGRPWEVWVVIAIVGLNILGNLIQGRFGGLLIGGLIISGLFKQTNGTWWFVTVVNGIAAIVCFALVPSKGLEMLISAVSCLIVVGLLVSCRVRGAYGAAMD